MKDQKSLDQNIFSIDASDYQRGNSYIYYSEESGVVTIPSGTILTNTGQLYDVIGNHSVVSTVIFESNTQIVGDASKMFYGFRCIYKR